MKLHKKRVSIIIVLCLLLALMVGCTSAPAPAIQPTETATAQVEPMYCPWEYDVSEKADGKLHYYFMASGGMQVNTSSTKWGDATLIVFPNGETMLMDSGQVGYAPVLLENLKRMGIEKLDYLLLTHSHSDHINGAVTEGGLFDSLPIGQVYISGVYNGKLNLYNDRIEDPYLVDKLCEEKDIPVQILQQGEVLAFGDVTMRILWPDKALVNQQIVGTEEVNNGSLVLRYEYGDHASIFPGDIYVSGEEALLAIYKDEPELLRAELLKMPHHGGNTSNSMEFAAAVMPELAIGSGYTNITGSIKSVYEVCGSEILSDKKNGYIHVVTDGTDMTWETSQ